MCPGVVEQQRPQLFGQSSVQVHTWFSFDYQELFSLGKGSTGCVQVFQVCQVCQVCQLGEVSVQSVQYVGGRTSQWSVGEEAVQERLFHQIPRQGVFFFCCLFAR